MSVLRLCLLVIAGLVFFIGGSSAQTALMDPKSLIYNDNGHVLPFKSKSAREMMSMKEYGVYLQALAKLDCETAHKVLNTAFIREYPLYERARLKPKCSSDRDCGNWKIYVGVRFKEYGYCTNVLGLNKAENEIQNRKLAPSKFTWKPNHQHAVRSDYWIELRNHALASLISQANLNYTPALIKLASLVRQDDVFNAGKETEYYILQRACNFSNNCSILHSRLVELRNTIAPELIAVIEKKAQETSKTQLILQKLLLGGKF